MLKSIVGKEYLYPKVKEIVEKAVGLKTEGKVLLIIGQPGSGKSVFMGQLYNEFKDKVGYLVAIRAEFVKKEDSPKTIYSLFAKTARHDKPKVLLIDSLDILAYARRSELQEWLYYIDKLKKIKGMTIICASRSFEAEHLYPMNQCDWSEKINIDFLPKEFINEILSTLNYDPSSMNSEFYEFLQIPLYLKVATQIIMEGGNLKNIQTMQGLYSNLFCTLNISTPELRLLTSLANSMIDNRTTYLNYTPQLHEKIKKIFKKNALGIIQIDSKNQRLFFFHQTVIDYLIALKTFEDKLTLIDFVLKYKQTLFIRPVLRHILAFLRSSSKRNLFNELNGIFFDSTHEIRMHIKNAILADIAAWENATCEEGKFLLRIFKETSNRDTLIAQFFNHNPGPSWYVALKNIYIIPTIEVEKDTSLEYRMILVFLKSIIKDMPDEILELSKSLLNKEYNDTIGWYVTRISEELGKAKNLTASTKETYSSFIIEAISKGFIKWYYEILLACNKIALYFPENGLKLYLTEVLKELRSNVKISSSQGSLTTSFNEVVPKIYEEIPYQSLHLITDFFETIFSTRYKENRIYDNPEDLLYPIDSYEFGLDPFYSWYKKAVLQFSKILNDQTKQLILTLQKSKWQSQQQLSMLCKMQNSAYYQKDILNYLNSLLKQLETSPNHKIHGKHELYLRILEQAIQVASKNQRDKIINRVLNLEFNDKANIRYWKWQGLQHISKCYHTELVDKKIDELQKLYGFEKNYQYKPHRTHIDFQQVQSPFSAEVLRARTNEELYSILVENNNLQERCDFDADKVFGGTRELAQTISKIFAENPEKYKDVVEKLASDVKNDEYLSWFFIALGEKEIQLANINWIVSIINLTCKRETVAREIAGYVGKIATIISKKQLLALKEAIISLSCAKNPEKDTFFESRSKGYSNTALGDGINRTRGAVLEIIIKLLNRFSEKWLIDILIKLAQDDTITVRAVVVRYLPYAIKNIGWDKAYEIFFMAFQKGPEEYHNEISGFLQYVPSNKFEHLEPILSVMKQKIKSPLGKCYSTLMTIYYLRDLVIEKELIEIFNDTNLTNKDKQEAVHILINHLKFKNTIDKSLKIILSLIKNENISMSRAGSIFINAQIEHLNKFILLINEIIKRPKIRGEAMYYMLQYLEKCLLNNPKKVFELLRIILDKVGNDFYNSRDYIPASHSKAPLNIINTILECYPELENEAMDMLDKLLNLKWQGIDEYLNAFDRF